MTFLSVIFYCFKMESFISLEIDEKIKRSLNDIGFKEMTFIQSKSIPEALKGKDIIGQSMTGSGKTAAFGVPIVECVQKKSEIQAIIIGPTRELVNQVSDEMKKFSKHKGLKVTAIFGGMSMEPQKNNLRKSDIVVATPGRLLDHIRRRNMNLSKIKIAVLDEADRMLDMGFIDDIRTILKTVPKQRQTMLFSATIPEAVKKIAQKFMNNPLKITAEKQVSSKKLKQFYLDCKKEEKVSYLNHTLKDKNPERAIVFCSTRGMTDFVFKQLRTMKYDVGCIHGGMSQSVRMDMMKGFQKGSPNILIATDVAARGLDINGVTHIFNYDVPHRVEDYTHRIGRTARFTGSGEAITLLCKDDHSFFRKIASKNTVKKIEKFENFKPEKNIFQEAIFC